MTNKPMLSVERELLEEMLAAMKETHSLPAKYYGSTLGDRVRAILESQTEPLSIGTLHRDCDERIVFESSGEINIKDGMQVYAMPSAQHQVKPVYQLRNTKLGFMWRDADFEAYASAAKLLDYERRVMYTEQPAPVAHTMRSVMDAAQQARGFPVLTSNQCHALAEALNGVKP